MILTCRKCSTSFRLDETLLKVTGSTVRCSLCQNMWVAFPPEPAPAKAGLFQADVLEPAKAGAAAATANRLHHVSDRTALQPDSPPELKLFADDDLGGEGFEDDDLVTDEINLGDLDQLFREEGETPSEPKADEDYKTEELDLADLEKMLALGTEQPPAANADIAIPEELDIADNLPKDLDAAVLDNEDSVIEELDLDLEDLENLLEEDTGLEEEIAVVEESTGGIEKEDAGPRSERGIPGEEIQLDIAPELADLLEEEEEKQEGKDEPAGAETTAGPSRTAIGAAAGNEDGADLDFELAPGLDGIFDEGDDEDVLIEETDELDFSDLSADLSALRAKTETGADDLEEGDLELELEDADESRLGAGGGLDELELLLDAEEADEPAKAGAPEIDLSDLSRALGAAAAGKPDDAGDEALEMDFDGGAGKDDASLELVMDPDSEEPLRSPAEGTETRELNVDELESLLAKVGDGDGRVEEDSSDSLDLDLDLDHLGTGDSEAPEDATRELDLDDIEKILGMDRREPEERPVKKDVSEDFDLDLDMDHIAPPVAPSEAGQEKAGPGDSLDLSELEKMLDVEDTTDSPGAEQDLDDLELDFELQPTTEESEELDLEFDMLEEEPVQASALFDTSESEDLGLDIGGDESEDRDPGSESDLHFEIIDEDRDAEETAPSPRTANVGAQALSHATAARESARRTGNAANRDLTQELMDEMAAADTQTMKAPPMETKPIKPAPRPVKRKKKSSVGLVLLFLVVLLGGAAYLVPKYTDIELPAIPMPDLSALPFVGTFFAPPATEAVVPVEPSLKGDWIQNAQEGRLYMVQGQVRNEYDSPRSYIRVTGRVYASGRQFQRAATAYCGNILTPEQLATLPLAEIQNLLSNRSGTDNRNVKVASGQELPFMIVFGNLPPEVELQEFAVEISGSLPVADAG